MPNSFRTRLLAARLAAGMIQQQAADLAGVRQKDWSAYELGVHDPTIARAEELAAAVGHTLATLLAEEE